MSIQIEHTAKFQATKRAITSEQQRMDACLRDLTLCKNDHELELMMNRWLSAKQARDEAQALHDAFKCVINQAHNGIEG